MMHQKKVLSSQIEAHEKLGRGVFSSRLFKRFERGKRLVPEIFKSRIASVISIDRLSWSSAQEMAKIAKKSRPDSREFHGWAVVSATQARRMGRTVRASPQEKNPYHGDIVLPCVEGDEVQVNEAERHRNDLAAKAEWRKSPYALQ